MKWIKLLKDSQQLINFAVKIVYLNLLKLHMKTKKDFFKQVAALAVVSIAKSAKEAIFKTNSDGRNVFCSRKSQFRRHTFFNVSFGVI